MHTHSSKNQKSLNKHLPENWWQLFMGWERSADGGIHAIRDHNNIRSVLQNTKETV
jgi:hypothetical protein